MTKIGDVLKLISLASLPALTGKSERTLWRWIADGILVRADDGDAQTKTMVQLDSVIRHLLIVIEPDDIALLESADAGDAEAQNDLALLFLTQNRAQGALYWLELAAKQGYAEAMHWLGRCYIDGKGIAKDDNMGIMWLAKAAAHGHMISQEQIHAMLHGFSNSEAT